MQPNCTRSTATPINATTQSDAQPSTADSRKSPAPPGLPRGPLHEIPKRALYDQWVRACSAAGVEDANLHDNRAFSATEARKQGLDPKKLLGHDDRKTTEIYLRDRIVEVVQGPTMRRILGA